MEIGVPEIKKCATRAHLCRPCGAAEVYCFFDLTPKDAYHGHQPMAAVASRNMPAYPANKASGRWGHRPVHEGKSNGDTVMRSNTPILFIFVLLWSSANSRHDSRDRHRMTHWISASNDDSPLPDQPIFLLFALSTDDQQCHPVIILTGGLTAGPRGLVPIRIADGKPLSAALWVSEPLPPNLPVSPGFFCDFQATLPPRGSSAVGWRQPRRGRRMETRK